MSDERILSCRLYVYILITLVTWMGIVPSIALAQFQPLHEQFEKAIFEQFEAGVSEYRVTLETSSQEELLAFASFFKFLYMEGDSRVVVRDLNLHYSSKSMSRLTPLHLFINPNNLTLEVKNPSGYLARISLNGSEWNEDAEQKGFATYKAGLLVQGRTLLRPLDQDAYNLVLPLLRFALSRGEHNIRNGKIVNHSVIKNFENIWAWQPTQSHEFGQRYTKMERANIDLIKKLNAKSSSCVSTVSAKGDAWPSGGSTHFSGH